MRSTKSQYEALARRENLIDPWTKGEYEGKKPLGERRYTQKRIRKEANGDIVLTFHNTDVLTFHKRGGVSINLGGWVRHTTMEFINIYLPWDMNVFRKAGTAAYHNGQWGTFELPDNAPFKITTTGEPVKPIKVVRWYVNRSAMNEARKTIKPFMNYVTLFYNLADKLDEGYLPFPIGNSHQTETLEQKVAALQGEDAEQWYAYLQTYNTRYYGVTLKEIREDVNKRLKLHYGKKVLFKKTLGYGEWKPVVNPAPVECKKG